MNSTRSTWSNVLHCNQKPENLMPVYFLSGFFCLLPVVFYIGNKIHGTKVHNRLVKREYLRPSYFLWMLSPYLGLWMRTRDLQYSNDSIADFFGCIFRKYASFTVSCFNQQAFNETWVHYVSLHEICSVTFRRQA